MKHLLLMLAVLIAAGSTQPQRPPTAPSPPATASQPVLESQYPYTEIAKIYDDVFESLTANYYSRVPAVDKQHTAPMRDFVSKQYPRAQFVTEMVQPHAQKFEMARTDPTYRADDQFKKALAEVVSASKENVYYPIRRQMYIYTAQFVDKDPVRTELLQMAANDDEVRFADCVSAQATPEEVAKRSPAYIPAAGDRIFSFRTQSQTWTNLMGRAGYLVVRNGKIAQVIITSLN
jgi:hypothetical protein